MPGLSLVDIAFALLRICIFMYLYLYLIYLYLHFYVYVLYSLLSVLQRAFSSWRQPISLRGARKNEESKGKNNWSRKKIIGDDFLLLFIIAAYSFWSRPTKPYQSVFILNFSSAQYLRLHCTFSMRMGALVHQRCCSASFPKSSRFVKDNWKLHSSFVVGPFTYDFQSLNRWLEQLF